MDVFWVGFVALATAHILSTNLRLPIMRKLFGFKGPSSWGHIVFHVANTLLIIAALAVALFTWQFWPPITPDADEMVQAAWTALFVAMVVTLLQKVSQYERGAASKYERAKKDLGDELAEVLEARAVEHDVGHDFLRSIVLAECIQRPAWIRRLERLKGRFIGPGTYGVAQVSALSPITDVESIEVLCQLHSGYYPVTNDHGTVNRALLAAQFETHNPDGAFVALATEIFDLERPNFRAASDDLARDGRATVEVLAIQRQFRHWIIRGSALRGDAELECWMRSRSGNEETDTVEISGHRGVRQNFGLKVPIEISALKMMLVTQMGASGSSLDLDLDDPWLD